MERTVVVTPAMSRLQRICASFHARFIVCLCFVLSHIVPKKRGSLAFYSQHQNGLFAGNLKYVFKHIHTKTDGRFSICWFTRDVNTYQNLRQKNYPCHLYRSTPFWQLLRSEFILLDTTPDSFFSLGNYKLIQLWHGSGFKRIGRFKLADSKASMLQTCLAKRAMAMLLGGAIHLLEADIKSIENHTAILRAPHLRNLSAKGDIFYTSLQNNRMHFFYGDTQSLVLNVNVRGVADISTHDAKRNYVDIAAIKKHGDDLYAPLIDWQTAHQKYNRNHTENYRIPTL